jgi:hypothetical protein
MFGDLAIQEGHRSLRLQQPPQSVTDDDLARRPAYEWMSGERP